MEFIPARIIRKSNGLNRKTFFKGVVVINDTKYLLYLLPEEPTQQYINGVRSELRNYGTQRIFNHTIILSPTREATAAFGDKSYKQDELLLLPYPAGVPYLKTISSVKEFLIETYPNLQPLSKPVPYANYETQDKYIAVLVLNDIAKREALTGYYVAPHQSKEVEIICLETQRNMFANLYPQAKIVVFQPENYQKEEL